MTRPHIFYYRNGEPILGDDASLTWAREHQKDRMVEQTVLWWGGMVSTVYLGIDHSFGGGPPMIFETMVSPGKNGGCELEMCRYSTEEEAWAGHRELCRRWSRASTEVLKIYVSGKIRRMLCS